MPHLSYSLFGIFKTFLLWNVVLCFKVNPIQRENAGVMSNVAQFCRLNPNEPGCIQITKMLVSVMARNDSHGPVRKTPPAPPPVYPIYPQSYGNSEYHFPQNTIQTNNQNINDIPKLVNYHNPACPAFKITPNNFGCPVYPPRNPVPLNPTAGCPPKEIMKKVKIHDVLIQLQLRGIEFCLVNMNFDNIYFFRI